MPSATSNFSLQTLNSSHLSSLAHQKQSFLCVGLDTDPLKLPEAVRGEKDPVAAFNREIIEATKELAIAYKINLAFYEAQGPKGWDSLARTLEALPPDALWIADAKRGDIGNTSSLYARAFFEAWPFHALTVAPYMGEDSVAPFLEYGGKWTFLLALTSNPGAKDFQFVAEGGEPLYQRVIRLSLGWAASRPGHLGFVVGATRTEQVGEVRTLAPDSWLLVPGVGAQGGDLEGICRLGTTPEGGLLINASRSILYASSGADFAEKAQEEARALQRVMASVAFGG